MHDPDAWHAAEEAWRIAQVLRIEPSIEGSADHTLGHDTLTN